MNRTTLLTLHRQLFWIRVSGTALSIVAISLNVALAVGDSEPWRVALHGLISFFSGVNLLVLVTGWRRSHAEDSQRGVHEYRAHRCTRVQPHDGPCNGFPCDWALRRPGPDQPE